MKKESNYHDATTGKFVTSEYAKENPDTTVEVTESKPTDISELIIGFIDFMFHNGFITKDTSQKKNKQLKLEFYKVKKKYLLIFYLTAESSELMKCFVGGY